MRAGAATLAVALTVTAACVRAPATHPYAPPAALGPDATIRALSRSRGLPLDAPIDVTTLDEAAFVRARGARFPAPASPAFWSAFTLASSNADVAAMAERLAEGEVSGFYDPRTKRLYTRADPTGRDRLTLAHEAEHALQDRFFGVPDLAHVGDGDESLALRALFEGDATLASVVLAAEQAGQSAAVVIARASRLGEGQDDAVVGPSRVGPVSGVPPLLRAQLEWPYVGGAAFVARLAASGGWSLVDAALRNPPKTTEQVLHVEKYVVGERAIEVRTPAAPDGYTAIDAGRMGELRARFVLAECVDDASASEAARGWGGDAYLIASRGADRALSWATAWDDEGAAARFATALAARGACARTGPKPPFAIAREGTRVAFVQGLDGDAARAAQARGLLALVGRAPPDVPPLGHVAVRARAPIPADFAGRGRVDAGARFVDAAYGIEADLGGLRTTPTGALGLLAVGDGVTVALAYDWAPPSDALVETFARTFAEARAKRPGAGSTLDLGASDETFAWGRARVRSLRTDDGIDARLVVVPACGGRMTIGLVTSAPPTPQGRALAAQWVDAVHTSDDSPACAALRSLRDPRDAGP